MYKAFSNAKIQGTSDGINEICLNYNYATCTFLHAASRNLAIKIAAFMLGIFFYMKQGERRTNIL